MTASEIAHMWDSILEVMMAIFKSSDPLAIELDPEALLRSIVSQAVELLGDRSGDLCLHRPEREVFEWVVPVGPQAVPVGSILHKGEGLSGRV